VELSAALRADLGQRCLIDLVNLLGVGRLAVGLGAVSTGLAAGSLGLAGERSLGERGGQAPAGARCLVELAAAGARSRLAGHGGVAEGLGSRHTRRVAYPHYRRGPDRSCPTPAAEQESAWTRRAKQKYVALCTRRRLSVLHVYIAGNRCWLSCCPASNATALLRIRLQSAQGAQRVRTPLPAPPTVGTKLAFLYQ